MTFVEAKKALKKLAKGDMHAIRYDLTEHSSKVVEWSCCVYINNFGHHSAETWQEALDSIKMKIAQTEQPIADH